MFFASASPDGLADLANAIPAPASAYSITTASYSTWLERWAALATPVQIGTSQVGDYPLYRYDIGATFGRPVLLTGVIHGGERPSMAILYWLAYLAKTSNHRFWRWVRNNLQLRFVPCVNPSGWQASTRENGNGVDINRNFATYWGANSGVRVAGTYTANPDWGTSRYWDLDEAVTQDTTGATGVIAYETSAHSILYIRVTSGTFEDGYTITGTSGCTLTTPIVTTQLGTSYYGGDSAESEAETQAVASCFTAATGLPPFLYLDCHIGAGLGSTVTVDDTSIHFAQNTQLLDYVLPFASAVVGSAVSGYSIVRGSTANGELGGTYGGSVDKRSAALGIQSYALETPWPGGMTANSVPPDPLRVYAIALGSLIGASASVIPGLGPTNWRGHRFTLCSPSGTVLTNALTTARPRTCYSTCSALGAKWTRLSNWYDTSFTPPYLPTVLELPVHSDVRLTLSGSWKADSAVQLNAAAWLETTGGTPMSIGELSGYPIVEELTAADKYQSFAATTFYWPNILPGKYYISAGFWPSTAATLSVKNVRLHVETIPETRTTASSWWQPNG